MFSKSESNPPLNFACAFSPITYHFIYLQFPPNSNIQESIHTYLSSLNPPRIPLKPFFHHNVKTNVLWLIFIFFYHHTAVNIDWSYIVYQMLSHIIPHTVAHDLIKPFEVSGINPLTDEETHLQHLAWDHRQ